jgi:hypothetical protein
VGIEAGVVAGYVIAWAVRKARRAAGRIDDEADAVVDASLDRLHEIVAARLAGHPALAQLAAEAADAARNDGRKVGELTCRGVEAALATTARNDRAFGQTVCELTARLREAQQAASQVPSRKESAVFTGDARADAYHGGIAIGQVAGGVHIARETGNPLQPGRSGH